MRNHKSKTINRKAFLKKACLGTCFCGFTQIAGYGAAIQQSSVDNDPVDKNLKLMQDWISILLSNIDKDSTEEDCRKLMKPCAMAHYNSLGMDKVLSSYIGDIEKFNNFLSTEWGWKIDYNPDTGVLTANENKSYCVCPLINEGNKTKSSVLCYCSEGIAEKMFSKVMGYPVTARVISSVIRGDKSCIYQVNMK